MCDPRPRYGALPALLIVVACAVCVRAEITVIMLPEQEMSPRDRNQKLVNANFSNKTDALGFNWDIDQNGRVGDGSNDCFDGGLMLMVNGSTFTSQQRQMTADGWEYILSRKMGNVRVSRRVLVDRERSIARYIESFTNTTNKPITLLVELRTDLGTTPASTVTSTGLPAGAKLDTDACGVFSISRGGSRPSVMFLISGQQARIQPTITLRSDDVYFQWQLPIPPKKTVSLFHVCGQRRRGLMPSTKSVTSIVEEFKKYYDRRLIRPDIPRPLRKTIVNFRVYSGISGEPLMHGVDELAYRRGLERGEQDMLWIDKDNVLKGRIQCDTLAIETAYGPTEVAWDDVAMLAGGAGVGAPMRLHLRAGEILRGPIEAAMTLINDHGLKLQIKPAEVHLLFARTRDADNHRDPRAQAMLQTADGQRLAIRLSDASIFHAATLWGPIRTPLDRLQYLSRFSQQINGHKLMLDHGSELHVMLLNRPIEVETLRYGRRTLPCSTITRLGVLRERLTEEEASPLPGAKQADQPTGPICELIGRNKLAGQIDLERLQIIHQTGEQWIDLAQIQSIERLDEGDSRAMFNITLRDASQMTGQLARRYLPIRTALRTWNVPVQHLVGYTIPEPDDDEPAGTATSDATRAAPPSAAPITHMRSVRVNYTPVSATAPPQPVPSP